MKGDVRADIFKWLGRWHVEIRDRWAVIDHEDFQTWREAMDWAERMLTP